MAKSSVKVIKIVTLSSSFQSKLKIAIGGPHPGLEDVKDATFLFLKSPEKNLDNCLPLKDSHTRSLSLGTIVRFSLLCMKSQQKVPYLRFKKLY